jgi:hypothetical protein
MILYVDQSIKIENTRTGTVIALSNDSAHTVLIPAAVKRRCQERLRQHGYKGNTIALMLFSAGLFLLVEDHLPQLTRLVIDTEYPGHDDDIRVMLLQMIRPHRPKFEASSIVFLPVSKQTRAHKAAIGVTRGKAAPNSVLGVGRLLRLLL